MNTRMKIALALGIAALLLAGLVAGGWVVYTAYAQGTTPTPAPNGANGFAGCHNNQAVVDLLKTTAADLQAQRQSGKSLLEIAQAKGVTEQALVDALMQPVESMHQWMGQNVQGFNDDQMDQAMRDQTAKDIRETKYGTMTDFRLFGGAGGMMNGWNANWPSGMMNGFQGMMNGIGGMMNGWTGARPGGMMGGRGMMGRGTY